VSKLSKTPEATLQNSSVSDAACLTTLHEILELYGRAVSLGFTISATPEGARRIVWELERTFIRKL
jgi:hypothetical protein